MKRTTKTLTIISSAILASMLCASSGFAAAGGATNITFNVTATVPAASTDFAISFEPLEAGYVANGTGATDYDGLIGHDHKVGSVETTSFEEHYGQLHVTLNAQDVTSITGKETRNTLSCDRGVASCAGKTLTANLYTDNAKDWQTGSYTLTSARGTGDTFDAMPSPGSAALPIGKATAMDHSSADWYLPAYFVVESVPTAADVEGNYSGSLQLQFTPNFV